MEQFLPIILQVVAGVIGGNAAGAAYKQGSLGATGNSVAGGLGGIVLGQILQAFMGGGAGAGLDIGQIVSHLVGGGVGGAVLAAIVGMIKNKMA
ncbi:MAG: hypothetical protein GEU91_09720 [Rhizobiales bacterium]|nr:hypothetical protein [Hyphomicrobiales bacterium]